MNVALNWIIDYFEETETPYLVCGGLAAIAYGAVRELNDIDIYVPEEYYELVSTFGKEYISYGPHRLINESWNVDYVQFIYEDQKIEVGSSEDVFVFNCAENEWFKKDLDFSDYSVINVLGRNIRVMSKEYLIKYKSVLNREVDRLDINQIRKT